MFSALSRYEPRLTFTTSSFTGRSSRCRSAQQKCLRGLPLPKLRVDKEMLHWALLHLASSKCSWRLLASPVDIALRFGPGMLSAHLPTWSTLLFSRYSKFMVRGCKPSVLRFGSPSLQPPPPSPPLWVSWKQMFQHTGEWRFKTCGRSTPGGGRVSESRHLLPAGSTRVAWVVPGGLALQKCPSSAVFSLLPPALSTWVLALLEQRALSPGCCMALH